MEAPRASDMFVFYHVTTRCHYPQHHDLNAAVNFRRRGICRIKNGSGSNRESKGLLDARYVFTTYR
jgi:hypothetical protein